MLRWQSEDTYIFKGVNSINKMNREELNEMLIKTIKLIKSDNGSYYKYDIDNVIFMRLQNNEELNKDIYDYFNELRDKIWHDSDYIVKLEDLIKILN